MARNLLLLVLSLASLAFARKCQDFVVEVDLSAQNVVFNLETPKTNIDVTNYITNMAKHSVNYAESISTGTTTVKGKYELQATYCEPDSGPSKVLQILTHGIAFDRKYWDLPFNNYNYSYVKTAVDDFGFSTITYDRLGLGQSSHGDPISEIQASLELDALRALTEKLRGGKIPKLAKKAFDKFVHVGHSFGSILSYSLTVENPALSDGLILTGFTQYGNYVPYFLLGSAFVQANSRKELRDYANGYIAPGVASAVQLTFFAPGQFDPKILDLAFKTGQPATPGELLTLGGLTGSPNPFTGPVLVITGNADLPFCGGDCSSTGNPCQDSYLDISAGTFKEASPFEAYVVPGAGHGLALEYSHVETTGKMLDFLTQNGLAGK
ncbi:Alpha/Beta hydrolase protein [Plectosphaerella plurivora]|uniref:Alpha/Beta hydrolase protein n=1 Tax=Plectosphaerella plurivora TaxID=936078 RepID=A0A9P8VFF4_9PEZI|nr:Alpha/Beta hydrolase protein [Plectosphaerella plurivora]